MAVIVFWLTPVVLVLILVLTLLRYQPKNRPKLVVIEPLLLLINRWHVSRVVGAEQAVLRQLRCWQQGLELTGSTIEQLCRQIVLKDGKRSEAVILEQQRLPFWAEQRVIESGGKKTAIICGSVNEVLEYCDADSEGALSSEKRKEWLALAVTAASNGFLALACAETAHANPAERRYRLSGVALLEPTYDQGALKKFRALSGTGQLRLLSFLPLGLLEAVRGKLLPAATPANGVTGQELQEMLPREQEAAAERGTVYAEMPTRNRYWIVRHLQRRHEIIVASRLPQDRELPADLFV